MLGFRQQGQLPLLISWPQQHGAQFGSISKDSKTYLPSLKKPALESYGGPVPWLGVGGHLFSEPSVASAV